jgi:hypothetical protein
MRTRRLHGRLTYVMRAYSRARVTNSAATLAFSNSGVVCRAACACGTKPQRGAWHVIHAVTDHLTRNMCTCTCIGLAIDLVRCRLQLKLRIGVQT